MIRTGLTALVALFALTVISSAQQQTSTVKARAAIMKEGRTNNQAMKHLDELVNGIGPRLTSSDNLTEACKWAVDKFQSFGIKNARMVEWGTFPVGFNRGTLEGKMTSPEKLDFELTTRCWLPGTQGATKGQAVLAPTNADELKALGKKLRGAWVLSKGSRFGRRSRGGNSGEGANDFREPNTGAV